MTLAEKITEIYLNEETWHKTKLSKEEANVYHERLVNLGNIITVSDRDILCGYVEYWRISYEQFGRIICGESFSAVHEDVQTGQIAYLANTYIRPEYRKGEVYKMLKERFLEVNKLCTHFSGRHAKDMRLRVFKRNNIGELVYG